MRNPSFPRMKDETIIALFERYAAELSELEIASQRMPAEEQFHTRIARLAHVTWMCETAKGYVLMGDREKAMRWLGFIQGVLWSDNVKSIDDMKEDNRY